MTANVFERNEEAIVFATNIDFKAAEELLWELFTQTGPVVSVFMPRDKVTGDHQGYAFVEFKSEVDAEYTLKILQNVKLFGRALKLSKASNQKKVHDIGANIFLGNLDPSVDERRLFDAFSAFGPIINCKIMRDPISSISKGYAYISYDDFESSDKALETMNNQFFSNRVIHIEYAYKKNTKSERHGSAAERLLAANRPASVQTGLFYGKNDIDYTRETPLIVPAALQPNKKVKETTSIANDGQNSASLEEGAKLLQQHQRIPETAGKVTVAPDVVERPKNMPAIPKRNPHAAGKGDTSKQ